MSRGDGRKDPADRLVPPQAAGMSCYSVAEEIMPGRADYLAVRRLLRLEQVKPALNAAKLPTDGSVVGHRRLAGWTNSWRSRTLGQCARCVRIFADWTSWRPPLALVSLLEFAPVGPARARKVWPHASKGRNSTFSCHCATPNFRRLMRGFVGCLRNQRHFSSQSAGDPENRHSCTCTSRKGSTKRDSHEGRSPRLFHR